ncbi:MAG: orotidine-5'-phosphate decarboxylase [Planctomycetes bacterium]|nr:orotidine-5'-phosphate decarboxylase [Planctomycetota bacterium]
MLNQEAASVTTESFVDRLHAAVSAKQSCLVVGLDPVLERLPPDVASVIGVRSSGGEGATARAAASFGLFLDRVIEAVSDLAVAVKPNSAYFERFGAAGWDCLRLVCERARAAGLLVILDAKRGDVGHTAEAYAEATLGDLPDTLGPVVDAVTLNPYLGRDSLAPFFSKIENGKGVFLLVRTSNPSAAEFQELDVGGQPLCAHVAESVSAWGDTYRQSDGWTSVGAVVGATQPERGAEMRTLMPGSYFLVPGVGAQGGRPEDLRVYFDGDGRGAVVNVSRSVLFAYEKRSGPWVESIRQACEETRDALEAVRSTSPGA